MTETMNAMVTLAPPEEFLSACPKFRILVLGNPESTKQLLFSEVFGVDIEKRLVADVFEPGHDIDKELHLQGQNSRLAVHASPNFLSGDQEAYERVLDFLKIRSAAPKLEDHIHCIWYCVASEESRGVGELEKRFFLNGLAQISPHVPIVLVFSKYEEFMAKVALEWSKGANERGLSKIAVGHILRDLSGKRFEQDIASKWDGFLSANIPRVCVSSDDEDDDNRSFEQLTLSTLATLRDTNVRYAFAAAQRHSASISTQFCADAATAYFEVDTNHARKIHGVDMRDILPNFLAKAIQIFNMRDVPSSLTDPSLLSRIIDATFGRNQKPLLAESLRRSGTESGTILLNLSPHERAVLLTQALAGIILFLHMLADTQWPQPAGDSNHYTYRDPSSPYTLTPRTIARELEETRDGSTGKKELLETIEASTIFTECNLKQEVTELIRGAVAQAEKVESPHRHMRGPRNLVVEDDSELQEFSMSFVNDHRGPGDVVLPCGLTILPLN
ncbi:hypothetical protein QBC38DRAFT_526160 [Podospora fimiseda]|uniref:G domain-containing protein n=1 Tax=Podospora fimiseda TaxID=252190 RepID=A0AAN7BRM3_9PEZI|nr:hypothetical protein QBC38DRAFT_526160 [Podospora fimiseda]